MSRRRNLDEREALQPGILFSFFSFTPLPISRLAFNTIINNPTLTSLHLVQQTLCTMTDKFTLTSDQIDDLLLSARYGDLEDLESTLSPLLTASSSTASSLLASIKNDDANTLLHYASANGHLDVIRYLLPYTDLPLALAQNISGNTALHWAGLNGHLDIVKALVTRIQQLEQSHPEQANKLNLIFHPQNNGEQNDGSERKLWDVRNTAGRGPMSEAQMRQQEQVVKFLLERMIDGPQDTAATLEPAEPLPPTASTEKVEQQTANLSLN